jgi:peptidyl-tRNA hydrolase
MLYLFHHILKAILRVRIGIDRPASTDMVINYVLTKFKPEEIDKINEALNQGIVKVAQRIGSQIGQSGAQIFRAIEDIEDSDDSSQSSDSTFKDNDVT